MVVCSMVFWSDVHRTFMFLTGEWW